MRFASTSFAFFVAGLVASCTASSARLETSLAQGSRGAKRLTIADLYDPVKKIDFAGNAPSGFVWLDDERWLWPKKDKDTKATTWLVVDAKTGDAKPFFDASKARAALAKIPGVKEDAALALVQKDTGALDPKHSAVVLSVANDLWYYAFGKDAAVRLTSTPDVEEELASFSPDGAHVSFVRANDLYVVDVDPPVEHRLTRDGGTSVLNGKLDWLYQEEVYGRGKFTSHWWSPDSSSLAFLRLDETGVPVYTLVDDVKEPIVVEATPYPRAGERNPMVQLGVARADGSGTTWVDLSTWKDAEPLVVDVGWSPRNALHFSVQDREQTWLELCTADATGKPTKLVRETTPAWTSNNGGPTWLADGTFLWFSEKDGWQHLYHCAADGKELGRLTSGEFEVTAIHGVDEANGWVYVSSTERSPIGSDVWRVKLDGPSGPKGRDASGKECLTSQRRGTHAPLFSPHFRHFLDTWSDVRTPPQVRVHAADGAEERVVDANPVPALRDFALSEPELLHVPTRDGFVMEAMLIKPVGFDARKKYPVFQHAYGGPHAPQVVDRWGRDYLFFQLLAQRGIAVWVCDNRTASGKGARSAWPMYLRAGEQELADVEDGLAWLKKQPWVDGERIGLSGWSYGGFLTSYALTHSTSFRMGIAGGSVTEWDEYDSIYTERYMKTPAHNVEGYAKSSVQKAAKDLHGALLLAHGAIDDNVHPGNTMRLAYELQKAGKPFELAIYPRSRHGIADPALVAHWRATMLRFVEEHLLEASTPPAP